MKKPLTSLEADIAAVKSIGSVPTILEVVCRTTGMGFAAIARVTEERWVACEVLDNIQFGLKSGGELKLETTICHEIRQHGECVVIDHVDEDAKYDRHHTPAMYGFKSYISMPIVLPGNRFFGTLCAIDPRPARLNTPEIIGMFKLFAELIAFHLTALEKLAESELQLQEERQTAELREQFIAVIGHDLRNPLSAIATGTSILQTTLLGPAEDRILGVVQRSVSRMTELIDNITDFARGRLGGGLTLTRSEDASLMPALNQIIAELGVTWPSRRVEVEYALTEPVTCDPSRIAQLFSNLLGNALSYSPKDQPVIVKARSGDGVFTLSVANSGEPIAPAAMERLFQPFARGEVSANQEGLGLGLYIAAEIARAHGGVLAVVSTPAETRFTLTMPTKAEAGGGAGGNSA